MNGLVLVMLEATPIMKRLLSFFAGFLFLLRAGAQPATGIYVMAYSANAASLTTSPATTQAAGSTILVWIGNGALSLLSGFPTDNKGNKYVSLGTYSYAPDWPSSGEALYVCTNAVGGSGHIFYWSNGAVVESTMMVVEVKNGGAIHDVQWNEATTASGSQTSLYATNSGPASIVAVWVGDAGAPTSSATPNNSFAVLNAQTLASGYVEGVTASKDLSAAGTNNVTWTCSPGQGAHMWMVAVQQQSSTQGPAAQGPAVTISSPANGAALTSPSLLVSGTATDSGLGNNGVSSVTVNGVSATGGTASGSGTADWSATITLTPGQNTITAVAYDTLNNTGQQQITVTYARRLHNASVVIVVPPSVEITDPMLAGNGQFQFTFNSTFGTQYTVQSSTNLIDWDFVQELSGSGGPLTGIDSNATGKGPRFYRVMVGRP